jgi:hypothetical protein
MKLGFAAAIAATGLAFAAAADDGMWTYHQPPVELLKSRYGFEVSREWLDHLRRASVSIGASGSFVSPEGLFLTNAHVALDCVKNLSSAREDLVGGGFVALARSQERPCPGTEARQLVSFADVTQDVDSPDATERRRRIAAIEQECREKTGLRCEVVTLYRGAQYWLYRYKIWNDMRLVFQPENDIAFFGGDTDNFVYPRFALDFALLRAYENGQPVKTPDYLKISRRGASEGDLVFSSGNPGTSDRLLTVAQVLMLRDRLYPLRFNATTMYREALHAYAKQSPESDRRALSAIHGTENYLKALAGETRALAQPELIAAKRAEEDALRAKAKAEIEAGRFRWVNEDPWQRIDRAVALQLARADELEATDYTFGTLVRSANSIVALAYEGRRPDGERLKDYREARAARLRRQIGGDSPYYKDLEAVRLASFLERASRVLGPQHPFVARLTSGESPQAAAKRLIEGTRLDQVAERRKLLDGGAAAVDASTDALIVAVRDVYPIWSRLKRTLQDEIEGQEEKGYDEIARLKAHLGGAAQAPDATGSLRFAFGTVKGYDRDGVLTPWATTFHGLYDRHASLKSHPYFQLPPRWRDAASKVRLETPFVFVTTVDIIGGSSGSPLVNRDGELVGVLFDGNLEELGNRFVYSDRLARSLAVDVRAMVEALDKVYGAQDLAREMRGQ